MNLNPKLTGLDSMENLVKGGLREPHYQTTMIE